MKKEALRIGIIHFEEGGCVLAKRDKGKVVHVIKLGDVLRQDNARMGCLISVLSYKKKSRVKKEH